MDGPVNKEYILPANGSAVISVLLFDHTPVRIPKGEANQGLRPLKRVDINRE